MDAIANADPTVDDRDLVLAFESIGDNCEFGILQRKVGVEPLGLLRFAGAPLRDLIRALNIRFKGIADPDRIRIEPENGEYMVRLAACNFTRHTDVKIGEMTAEAVHEQQCRVIRFLANKLVEDLENPAKILIFRQNEPLAASDLIDLRLALSRYGPNTLLWVQEARAGHPPGSVDVVDERMMVGYIRRFADRDRVPDLDRSSWLRMLRNAHAIALRSVDGRLVCPSGSTIIRTDLTFGRDGNAGRFLGAGWSGPEAGFTWAIDERSSVTVGVPAEAADYWLEMQIRPYLASPLLPRQRLDIAVSGTLVHRFPDLPRGEIGCSVPSALVAGRASVEITLEHPDAASPKLIAGERDDRRLAIAFSRLSLVCA
jgi:hypothetical protein